jgi:hypothetical protein
MLDAWNRPDNRDLAEECRRLAASTLSDQMKKRYLLMAERYSTLAEADELRALPDGRQPLREPAWPG